jgi:hypothetical protein
MKNKIPSTIADLKFNFVFTNYKIDTIPDKEAKFRKQNKSLLNYKIQHRDYKFLVNDEHFYVCASLPAIDSFIEYINHKLNYSTNLLPKKLTRFELVEENTFRIHLEEVPVTKPKAVKPAVKK